MNLWVKKDGIVHFQGRDHTLCGRPMLGNNWLQERRVMCQECLDEAVGHLGHLEGLILDGDKCGPELDRLGIKYSKGAVPSVFILEPFTPAIRICWSDMFGYLRSVNNVFECIDGRVVTPLAAPRPLETEWSGYYEQQNLSLDQLHDVIDELPECRVVNKWGFMFVFKGGVL